MLMGVNLSQNPLKPRFQPVAGNAPHYGAASKGGGASE